MKELLKGKALEDFEKWYLELIELKHLSYKKYYLDRFFNKSLSEQYGVLEDWFDSVGIHISIEYNEVCRMFGYYISTNPIRNDIYSKHEFKRPEARIEAIKKGVEIHNN